MGEEAVQKNASENKMLSVLIISFDKGQRNRERKEKSEQRNKTSRKRGKREGVPDRLIKTRYRKRIEGGRKDEIRYTASSWSASGQGAPRVSSRAGSPRPWRPNGGT